MVNFASLAAVLAPSVAPVAPSVVRVVRDATTGKLVKADHAEAQRASAPAPVAAKPRLDAEGFTAALLAARAPVQREGRFVRPSEGEVVAAQKAAIRAYTGRYSEGVPFGAQLDAARAKASAERGKASGALVALPEGRSVRGSTVGATTDGLAAARREAANAALALETLQRLNIVTGALLDLQRATCPAQASAALALAGAEPSIVGALMALSTFTTEVRRAVGDAVAELEKEQRTLRAKLDALGV